MNLREAFEAAEIEVRNGATEEECWICCPFCVDRGETVDNRFRLGVNLRTGQAQCFNCQWKARGEYTFKRLQQALATGEIQAAQDLRSKKRHHKKVKLPEDFELLKPPSKETDHWNNVAWRYVRKRGISEHQIRDKKIGFSITRPTNEDELDMSYRVIFPVYVHGKLRGLVGRDFTDKQEIKYKNSVGGKALYNVKEHKHSTVCLLEGVIDTLVVERVAKKLSIDTNGLLGHDLTDDQLELLHHYKTIILWTDPDEAGIKGALKIAKKIPHDKILRVVLPMKFKHPKADDADPSELESKVIEHRLLGAKRFTEDLQLSLRAWAAFGED